MEIIFTLDQISEIVKNTFLPLIKEKKIFTFTGPLGAGKTTLIKEIFKQCGIKQVVSSPTFGYVNTYRNDAGLTFHHFDLYRIDSLESFVHQGLDEYFYQEKTYCFIEWPEVVKELLRGPNGQLQVCEICISYLPENTEKRTLVVKD